MQPLRVATLADAAAIARVKIAGWRSTYSEWIETELLTEISSRVGSRVGSKPNSPPHRRSAFSPVQTRQRTMRVTVVKENQRARSFYERLGAHYEGMWPAPWAPQHAIEEAAYRWTDLDQLSAQSGEPFG